MKTTKLKKCAAVIAGMTLISTLGLQAATNVVYFDPFTGSAGASINNTAPKDHGGTGTDLWVAPDDGMLLDGSALSVTSGSRWAALPFYPEDGNKYKLSMDMNPTHTGSDWFAIGFSQTPNTTGDYGAQLISGWILNRGLNPGVPLHSFTGYGTDGGAVMGSFTGPHNLAVILDTTVGNWTYEYFVDNVSQRGPVPFSTTPDINPAIYYVTFGSYNTARGIMDNFKLEVIYHVEAGVPSIVDQPQDATVVLGGSAQFSVSASGPKPITYQWMKNNSDLTGETGSTLTVANLAYASNGDKYSVKVSNSFGSTTTSNATLTVVNVAGPLMHKITFNDGTANDSVGGIKGTLKGAAAIAGGQLILDGSDSTYVSLGNYIMPPSGNATVVAWFRTSANVGGASRVFDFGNGTLNYLYFSPLTGSNARLGLKTGDDAEINLSYTPVLNDYIDHMVAAVIDSTPTDTGLNGTMYLYIDGVPVGTNNLNGTVLLSGLSSGPQNFIGKSQWVNTGDAFFKGVIDEIRVYNTALTQAAIAALAPDANPATALSISAQPQDTIAFLDGVATLSVDVRGSQPAYQWFFDGAAIANSNTNIYYIAKIGSNDFGAYSVVASNSFGSVTSTVAHLTRNLWSYEPWTDDATSGVDTNYYYTHAYSFGSADNTTINGLVFKGMSSANPFIQDAFAATGVDNVFLNDANNIPDGSGSRVLANNFIYGGNPGTLKLSGLLPGKDYLLTLFSVAFDAKGGRWVRFSAADNQTILLDQDVYDIDNGIRISYQYTADANGSVTITTTPSVAGSTFHCYGFCNRLLNLLAANEAPEISTQPASASAALDGSVKYSVVAVGTAPLSYQWQFNGTNIVSATADSYTVDKVLSSNFGNYSVVVRNPYGSVTSIVAHLSLLRWSYTNWSDDASMGVSNSFVYTHAFNLGAAKNTEINGVQFTGVAGINPSVSNKFAITGVGNVYNGDVNDITGNCQVMATDFIYGGNPGTLTLYGLTPGTQYVLTYYSVGWDASGRVIQFNAADGQQLTVDQDTYNDNAGIRISYQYTADANGSVSVTNRQVGTAGTFHTYGFSNYEIPGSAVPQLAVSASANGSVIISWNQSATGYTLESSPVLPAKSWTTVTGVENNRVTISSKSGTQFFRLRKP